MPKLTLTIQNEDGQCTGSYIIDCVERPDIDVVSADSIETINLVRVIAERRLYEIDFRTPPTLYHESVSINLSPEDFSKGAADPLSINELWFEFDNLLAGCRLNFITARMIKDLEIEQYSAARYESMWRSLHLDKLERFHLGVFELTRIEDLIVRLVYEYFGHNFIDADTSSPDWERKLTWWAMMESLKKKKNGSEDAHPRLNSLPDSTYVQLMSILRSYKSKTEVVRLIQYRNARMHRVTPSVDYVDMYAAVPAPHESGLPAWLRGAQRPTKPDYLFIELYEGSKKVYTHLTELLVQLKQVLST